LKGKKYLYVFTLILILFTGFHFITWNLFTKEFFPYKDNISIGDLGRMSYLTKSLTFREGERNLPLKHIEYIDNVEIDVLTIGDSFSNGGGGGVNNYYQDYIATIQNLKVMNMQPSRLGFIETLLILIDNDILDKLNPKIIILQTVERSAILRFSKKINWDIGSRNYSTLFLDRKYPRSRPRPSFINKLNHNVPLYSVLYKYDDNAIFSKVYTSSLTRNLFSSEDKNKLLFYFEDLKYIPLSNQKSISLLNDNLNKLQNILGKKNIKLFFMPSVDKYNLYSKYIKNNPYKESQFFELLRPLKKEYHFIDTKKILSNLLEKDVQDLYYSDDSHWSHKANKEIFQQIKLR
jgi:hypothetical protein